MMMMMMMMMVQMMVKDVFENVLAESCYHRCYNTFVEFHLHNYQLMCSYFQYSVVVAVAAAVNDCIL